MSGGKRLGILLDDNDPTLFPKLTDEQMDLLARNGQVRPTQSGEVLFREGDATNDVIVVQEGSVVVTVGRGDSERELAIQRPRAELNVLTCQKVGETGIVREAGWVLAVA